MHSNMLSYCAYCQAPWFENVAADGFNILPRYLPGGLEDFVDLVVPELQRRGLCRAEYEGATLRDHLGLARPARIKELVRFHEGVERAAV
jgi:hypothetical protein